MAPAVARWPALILCALEGGPGGAGGGEHPTVACQHDLGVGAHVDDQPHSFTQMRAGGEHDGGGVGTHMPCYARQHVDPGGRVCHQVQPCGGEVYGIVDGKGERRAAQGCRVEPEEEVVHYRVADEHQFDDLVPVGSSLLAERADQAVECGAHGHRELDLSTWVHHHVGDPAHQVLAEPDLWIHGARGGQHRTGGEVAEVSGDGRGADVDCDAQCPVTQAGPDGDHLVAVADRHGHGS